MVNALVRRRAGRLPTASWGSGDRFAWGQGEIVFQRLGEGEPIVLLHAFGPGHSGAEWRRVAEMLAQTHEVFVPDLLGWGLSDSSRLVYDARVYLRLLRDFLDRVVERPVILVAAGLPAAYAVQWTVEHPGRARALGLVCPFGVDRVGEEPGVKDAVVHRLLRLPVLGTAALNIYSSRAAIAGYLRREVYAAPAAVDDALIDEHYRSSHQRGNQAALAAYLSGSLHHEVRDILSRLEVPVWLAWGRHALSPPVETADVWLRRIEAEGGAGLEVFERCGILPHAESPEEFTRKLERFLSRLDA